MDFDTLSRKEKSEILEKLFKLLAEEAENRALSAHYNGSFNDGGATAILEEVDIYKKGMNMEIPKQWEKHLAKLDSEYDEYIRLKKKFEGKS